MTRRLEFYSGQDELTAAREAARGRGRRVVVIEQREDLDALAAELLACLDERDATVLAPVTADHFSRRPLFVMTIPKSGTHMLIKLLEAAGIPRSFGGVAKPGHWNVIDPYSYHAPCRDFLSADWTEGLGRHPFFRSPAIFMYRHPLDVLASELSWYRKDGHTAFSRYVQAAGDPDAQALRLIDDPFVLGSLRDRINRYTGWLDFPNVASVSYEELVGPEGGGDREAQVAAIWSLQLKLHVPGSPEELAARLYDRGSATFDKGMVGRFKDVLKPHHYDRLTALPQDFMEKLGYALDAPGMPIHVDARRNRPLEVWRPKPAEEWVQRLVLESYHEHNVVLAAGQYFAIPHAAGTVDLANAEHRSRPGVRGGFSSLGDAKLFVVEQLVRRLLYEQVNAQPSLNASSKI